MTASATLITAPHNEAEDSALFSLDALVTDALQAGTSREAAVSGVLRAASPHALTVPLLAPPTSRRSMPRRHLEEALAAVVAVLALAVGGLASAALSDDDPGAPDPAGVMALTLVDTPEGLEGPIDPMIPEARAEVVAPPPEVGLHPEPTKAKARSQRTRTRTRPNASKPTPTVEETPVPKPKPKAKSEPSSPSRERLSTADVRTAMSRVKTDAKMCAIVHGAVTGEKVAVKLSIEGATGRVVSATPQSPHGTDALGRCVASALGEATFPTFARERTGIIYKVTM